MTAVDHPLSEHLDRVDGCHVEEIFKRTRVLAWFQFERADVRVEFDDRSGRWVVSALVDTDPLTTEQLAPVVKALLAAGVLAQKLDREDVRP